MKKIFFLTALLLSLNLEAATRRAEPAYCTLQGIKAIEKKEEAGRLVRSHVYQIGQVIVAGLGVGNSKASEVKKLAAKYSNASAEQKFCTWYINDGNSEAEKAFNWKDVPRPNTKADIDIYMKSLGPAFHSNPINMVSCAQNQRYLALGCNGMQHRGPTMFGMLLAYSGCNPDTANATINSIWGLNGVDKNVRLTIIKKAYDLGRTNLLHSQKLQEQFLR